jgi:hypothetical protein
MKGFPLSAQKNCIFEKTIISARRPPPDPGRHPSIRVARMPLSGPGPTPLSRAQRPSAACDSTLESRECESHSCHGRILRRSEGPAGCGRAGPAQGGRRLPSLSLSHRDRERDCPASRLSDPMILGSSPRPLCAAAGPGRRRAGLAGCNPPASTI